MKVVGLLPSPLYWLLMLTVVCHLDDAAAVEKRVINGQYATPHAYPWALSMQHRLFTGSGHICGAVLVSPDFAITAGHCVSLIKKYMTKSDFALVCGAHNISNTGESSRQVLRVKDWQKHPQYTVGYRNDGFPIQADNDIAVIQFTSNATINANCKGATFSRDDFTNSVAHIAGWGYYWARTRSNHSGVSDVLKEGTAKVMSGQDCENYKFPDSPRKTSRLYHLCVSFTTQAACVGDSGGPLHVNNGKTQVVIGLSSFGAVSCPVPGVSVYTHLSKYLDWVEATIQQMRSTA